MNLRRLSGLFPLLFVFVLLFAQQQGMAHAIHHAAEDLSHKRDHSSQPHSGACQQCADYAQHGSALGVARLRFAAASAPDAVPAIVSGQRGATVFAVPARGPPILRAA